MAAGQAPDRLWLLPPNADTVVAGVLTVTGTTGAGTTANPSTSQPIDYKSHGIVTFYLRSIGTTSGGTIVIEEADWGLNEQPYSGTWSQIASIAASSFTGGAQIAYHVTDSAYGWLRARISSPITGGGSVTISLRSRGAA